MKDGGDWRGIAIKSRFQSPCGEVVMKAEDLSRTPLMQWQIANMFQSPCGEVVMKGEYIAQRSTIMEGFQSPCGEVVMKEVGDVPVSKILAKAVSVPLRGSGDESIVIYIICQIATQFQSPCGEVVIKAATAASLMFLFGGMFQSPCGEVVMKADRFLCLRCSCSKFQSPCGEVVMKVIIVSALCQVCLKGFSPLTGKW